MGFTPLEGLMMGTYCGSIGPSILVYLLRQKCLDADQLDHVLNYASGLLGVSGVSFDMRQVLAVILHVYVYRIRQTVGALAATLGGVDALVFTAGVGEHAAGIREWVCDNLHYLGLILDRTANNMCQLDADIALADLDRPYPGHCHT
jgi:acetate kinase